MPLELVAIGMAGVIGVLLTVTLLRGRADDAPPAAYDLRVYREQLAEVDRDLARGVITEEEASRIRTEVSRRVLEADRKLAAQPGGGQAPTVASLVTGAVLLVLLLGGAWLLYSRIGAPGQPDQPLRARIADAAELRANRPSQGDAEAQLRQDRLAREEAETDAPPAADGPQPDAEFLALMEQLRRTVAENQDDPRGFELLAINEARLGDFEAAHRAQARLIELKAGQATADDYAILAEMMMLAADGYISPEAEAALEQALNRDPRNGMALYYWGLMHIQTDRPDTAFRVWRELLSISGPDDPWLAPVRAGLPELAWYAGDDNYSLPPPPMAAGLRGPSAEDMEAAAEMSPEQRQEMIRNMVANLSDRLATQGGGPQEWAQLINALGVLGDTEQAGAIWAEAQQAFAANPEALETVRRAARSAGVAE